MAHWVDPGELCEDGEVRLVSVKANVNRANTWGMTLRPVFVGFLNTTNFRTSTDSDTTL